MHILFLTDNFPPEVNAPASRTVEHCREWVLAGHQVTVVTCAPNFPRGEIFSGYTNKLYQKEVMDGIQVVRVWTYMAANSGFLKRTLDYVSFMFASIFAGFTVAKVDLVIGTSPQFFTACAAFVLGVVKRKPWVFELRDIWPESIRAVEMMRPSFLLNILEKIEIFLYHRAALIVPVTHSFKQILMSRGIPEEKIKVVTNGVDLVRFHPTKKSSKLLQQYGLKGKFIAGYIGTHGLAHALESVLEAAQLVMQSPGCEHIHFLFLGDGARKNELVEMAAARGLVNVTFIDSVAKELVLEYWSLLDVSLIHLRASPLFEMVIPSKLFESMAMGIPVVHCVNGESAKIVRRENVGLTVAPEVPEQLAEAIQTLSRSEVLYKEFSENGPVAARNYDRSVLANYMLKVLKDTELSG